MKHLVRPLAPLLVAAGAAILIFTAGAEIAAAIRSWLFAGQPWPHELMLHVLIAGAALLLASAVIMTRRSAQRTEEAEDALRESEERPRLIANNWPGLPSNPSPTTTRSPAARPAQCSPGARVKGWRTPAGTRKRRRSCSSTSITSRR